MRLNCYALKFLRPGEMFLLKKIFSERSLNETNILETRDLYAHALVLEHEKTTCYAIVLDLNSYNGTITYGTIAHEAHHIKNMIFNRRGMIADFSNDEAGAYLVEYITDFVCQNLNKWNILNEVKLK